MNRIQAVQARGLYDVIIAGGGPAGASAAFFLGEAGNRVLVLEKEKLPRYKTCGGALSVKFLREQFPFSFEPVLQARVEGMAYAVRDRMYSVPIRAGIIGMVMREQFDAHLLRQAKADLVEGAVVRSVTETEEGVIVETRDGARFEGRYLIGADGASSAVAHALGLRRGNDLAAAIEAEAPVSADAMQRFGSQPLFIFGEIRSGYLWIFPKADHLSVGIAALHPKRGVLQSTLRRVMARYGISLENVPLRGHPIPLYTRGMKIATKRTLLAGDAAGLVDPTSGEGIRYAIKSGRLAAEAVLTGRITQYEQVIFRKIGLEFIFSRLVAKVFYTIQGLCVTISGPNPFATQAIVEMLSDEGSTLTIFLTAIVTLPIYLATEAAAGLAGLFGKKALGDKLRAGVYQG